MEIVMLVALVALLMAIAARAAQERRAAVLMPARVSRPRAIRRR
jgi:hypothetical protein